MMVRGSSSCSVLRQMVQSDAAEDNAVFKRRIWRILRIVYYVRNNSAWLDYQRGRLGTTFSSQSQWQLASSSREEVPQFLGSGGFCGWRSLSILF